MKLRSGRVLSATSIDGNVGSGSGTQNLDSEGEQDDDPPPIDNMASGNRNDAIDAFDPESAQGVEVVAEPQGAAGVVAESAQGVEVVADPQGAAGVVAESAQGVEVVADPQGAAGVVAESAQGVEVVADPQGAAGVVAESAQGVEVVAEPQGAAGVVAESAQGVEVVAEPQGAAGVVAGEIKEWAILEELHNRWIDEHMNNDTIVDQQNEIVNEKPPKELVCSLFRHQKEWLAWALKQEESPIKGGILADETGMGKTLEAIALVLAKRERLPSVDVSLTSSSAEIPNVKGTLVVCPAMAVSLWADEIRRFTLSRSTKVLICLETNRVRSIEELSEYDFVLTTYSTVEYDYVSHCKEDRKQEERDDNQKSIFHSVKWLRIILDEGQCIKYKDHVAIDHVAIRGGTRESILALESSYKWALIGTLLENNFHVLHSLIRFLRIMPYAFYFCKDCNCRILDYRTPWTVPGRSCMNCAHTWGHHFCWWYEKVAFPIKVKGGREEGRRAIFFLKQKILKEVMLRRTKEERASELDLPSRVTSIVRFTLDTNEQEYYTSMFKQTQDQFNKYYQEQTVMHNYDHILSLLLRLSQVVNYPYLVRYYATNTPESGISSEDSNIGIDNEEVCGICDEVPEDLVVTSCGHAFCKACLIFYSNSLGEVSCPSCSEVITVDLSTTSSTPDTKMDLKGFMHSVILKRIRFHIHYNQFQTSTKIEALREEIRLMFEKDVSAKAVVFSQFSSFLDLIGYSLQQSGINCVQLVGSMSTAARDAAIKSFTEDPDCRIFLISLKVGGVALNLTAASHVFLMEPWLNPAAEQLQQVYGRVHRIGQCKPVRIVRFIIENTVEEKILELQQKEERVFEGTISGTAGALEKQCMNDLEYLFMSSN